MMNMVAAVRETQTASVRSATGISATPIFVLFAIFIAVYFPMMTVLPLSIDAEITTLSTTNFYWIAQGRWGAYVVTQLFPPHLVPYLTMAIFGAAASLGYTLVLQACGLRFDWRAGLGFAVFCGFPIWSLILEFSSNTVQVGLALLCCCSALWLLVRRMDGGDRRGLSIVAEIAIVAFAIALYQALLFVYATLVVASLLLNRRSASEGARMILHAVGVVAVAIIGYYVVGKIFSASLGVAPAYVGQFIRFDAVFGDPIGTIKRTFTMAFDAYTGDRILYGQPVYAATAVLAVFIVVVGIRLSAWHAFLAVCLLALPFALFLTAGGYTFPPRGLLAIPVAVWAMSMIAMKERHRSLRVAGTVAVCFVIFQSAAAISSAQAVRDMRTEFDRRIASEIHTAISQLADGPQQKVDFFGGVQPPQPVYGVGLHSTAAGSFFAWDGGNPARIFGYMHLLGYQDIVQLGAPERQALKPEFDGMPVWPRSGSVRRFQDVVLVKLSDTAGVY